jgi:hypothetical protein
MHINSTGNKAAAFYHCPRCKTLRGPTAACPGCGWLEGCAWCKSRVWVPGSGWVLSELYSLAKSHGMCPWCAARALGISPSRVDLAAERLRIPPGLVQVKSKLVQGKRTWVWLGHWKKTGWAGTAGVA